MEDKAGKHTFGIGRFYSSLSQRAIRSVSFPALSFIDVQTRKSSLVGVAQLLKSKPGTADPTTKETQPAQEPKRGRPKGSGNKPGQKPQSYSYQSLKTRLMLCRSQWKAVLPDIKCFHLVLDGFYGHCAYLKLARENELNIKVQRLPVFALPGSIQRQAQHKGR